MARKATCNCGYCLKCLARARKQESRKFSHDTYNKVANAPELSRSINIQSTLNPFIIQDLFLNPSRNGRRVPPKPALS